MSLCSCNSPVVDNIKRIISERGYKNKSVAEKAGFSPRDFSNLLNGRKILRASDIPPIARALSTDPNSLFIVDKETNPPA